MPGDRLTGTILDYAEQGGASGDWAHQHGYRPGAAAAHALGVRFQGPWDQVADGFHEHVRRQARALALVGCPVHLQGIAPLLHYGAVAGSEEEKVLALMAPLTDATIARAAVQIQMTVPNEGQLQRLVAFSQMAMRVLDPDDIARILGSRIVYTVWERGPAPPADVAALSRVAQAWTACEDNRRMLIASGLSEEKVRTVPLPYFDDDPLLEYGKRRKKPRKVPRFYHIGKWEPRKDQHRMLGCFLRAFRPGEAEIYIKTSVFSRSFESYPSTWLGSVRHWMVNDLKVTENGWRFPGPDTGQIDPDEARGIQKALGFMGVKIYDTRLSVEQMLGLHGACDVYLSLSHGEGWDMPAFDAKLAGNLMVYTRSGGPQDYADENDLVVPIRGRIPAHQIYRWPEGSTYIDHDDELVETLMKQAAEYVRMGEERAVANLERFRAESVGKLMLKYARELADNLPGDAG